MLDLQGIFYLTVTCLCGFYGRVGECACEVESCGLELRTGHFQTAREYTEHQLTFLLLGVGSAGLVVHIVLRVDCPCAHCQAELNIRFDLACVGGAVEQSKLYRSFGEECVEVDAVVSCGVVVLMVDAAAVIVVHGAIPNAFQLALCHLLIGFHCVKELTRHLLAPTVCAVLDLQSFVEKVLSADCKVHKAREALGRMVGAIDVDVNTARGIRESTFGNESADDVLKILDVLVLKNGRYNLATILATCRNSATVNFAVGADARVAHSFPRSALAVGCTVCIVAGSDISGSGTVILCDNCRRLSARDACHFNLYTKILSLNFHFFKTPLFFLPYCVIIGVVGGVRLPPMPFGFVSDLLWSVGHSHFIFHRSLSASRFREVLQAFRTSR